MMSLVKIVAFTFILANVKSVICEERVFFVENTADENDGVFLLVAWDENEEDSKIECDIIPSGKEIEEALKSDNAPTIDTITEDDLHKYLEECDTINDHSEGGREVFKAPETETTEGGPEAVTQGYDGMNIIFPGTKWCGAGDKAKNYDDLGIHQDTDRCCRAHDLCNDTLAPKETRNNLTNTSPFTTLSCKCDHDFYNCLDRVNTVTSNTIGNMYFNVLRRQCYKEDYPDSKKCKKYIFLKLKCLEYEKNTKAPKEYQWVKARKYTKIPFPGPLTLENIIPF